MVFFDESDNDTDSGDEMWEQNDAPLPGIDPVFSKQVHDVKHSIYSSNVLSGNAEDDDTQNTQRLDNYLKDINNVYIMTIICQNGKKNANDLSRFPLNTRDAIRTMLEWVEMFFSKNTIPDIIPYQHYIRNHFHVYPYVQNNSFE